MANTKPYKDPAKGNRWTIDADPDDELYYVANVVQWLTDSATETASFETVPQGVVVLLKGAFQGALGGLLPVKLKVPFSDTGDTFCTFRTTTLDGQKFDKTIWFNRVDN